MPRGKSSSSLSEDEAQALLSQADAKLKCARGKALLQQITPPELRALFDDLPRDEKGLLNFHQCQVAETLDVMHVFLRRDVGGTCGGRERSRPIFKDALS